MDVILKKVAMTLGIFVVILGLAWGGLYIYYNHTDIQDSSVIRQLGGAN